MAVTVPFRTSKRAMIMSPLSTPRPPALSSNVPCTLAVIAPASSSPVPGVARIADPIKSAVATIATNASRSIFMLPDSCLLITGTAATAE